MSSQATAAFIATLQARFPEAAVLVAEPRGEVTLEFPAAAWREAACALRDEFGFEQLVDLCGVDYMGYGSDEWDTTVSSEGYSRGVEGKSTGRLVWASARTTPVCPSSAVSPSSPTCCR